MTDNRPEHEYAPLYGDEDFESLQPFWQWNHIPDQAKWCLAEQENGPGKELRIQTGKICRNLTQAPNTLTQRLMYPGSRVTVTVDGSHLMDGDVAGLCLLQSDYGMVGITRENGQYYLVQIGRPGEAEGNMNPEEDATEPVVRAKMPLSHPVVTIRFRAEFTRMKDVAYYEVRREDAWQSFGEPVKLHFKLDHFCGVRAGLCCYATEQSGGYGAFRTFRHKWLTDIE